MITTKRVGRKTVRAEVHPSTEGWVVSSGRFGAVIPWHGPEVDAWMAADEPTDVDEIPERVREFVDSVLRGGSHTPTRPKREGHGRRAFIELDGEETVWATPYRSGSGWGGPVYSWSVTCDSRHCRERGDDFVLETLYLDSFQQTGPIIGAEKRLEERAREIQEAHIQWHRKVFGVHGMTALGKWLDRTAEYHKVQGFTTDHLVPAKGSPARREIDRQLSIAKAES